MRYQPERLQRYQGWRYHRDIRRNRSETVIIEFRIIFSGNVILNTGDLPRQISTAFSGWHLFLEKMGTIDWIIIILVGLGVIQGLMQGFVKQLASIVGIIAGLLLARALFGVVGEQLAPKLGTSTTVAQIIAFILIWVIVPIALSLIASIITKALSAIKLGWLNRWLGSGLGAVKFILLIGIFIHVLEYIDTKKELFPEEKRQESVLYQPVKELSDIFFPAIKGMAEQIL